MGVFDEVYVKCPHCGYDGMSEQYKPSSMQTWEFGVSDNIPLDYLHDFNDRDWTCFKCKKGFVTRVEIKVGEQQIIKDPAEGE